MGAGPGPCRDHQARGGGRAHDGGVLPVSHPTDQAATLLRRNGGWQGAASRILMPTFDGSSSITQQVIDQGSRTLVEFALLSTAIRKIHRQANLVSWFEGHSDDHPTKPYRRSGRVLCPET